MFENLTFVHCVLRITYNSTYNDNVAHFSIARIHHILTTKFFLYSIRWYTRAHHLSKTTTKENTKKIEAITITTAYGYFIQNRCKMRIGQCESQSSCNSLPVMKFILSEREQNIQCRCEIQNKERSKTTATTAASVPRHLGLRRLCTKSIYIINVFVFMFIVQTRSHYCCANIHTHCLILPCVSFD